MEHLHTISYFNNWSFKKKVQKNIKGTIDPKKKRVYFLTFILMQICTFSFMQKTKKLNKNSGMLNRFHTMKVDDHHLSSTKNYKNYLS